MGVRKLNPHKQQNRFNLPDKYLPDLWDVTSWDVYKNTTDKHQSIWRNRAGKDNNYCVDFSVINCEEIRNELKYCLYLDFESNVNLSTLAEKYSRLKNVIKFYNDRKYNSIVETDIHDYEIYLVSKLGLKKTVDDGKRASIVKGKMVKNYRKNRNITFLESVIKTITKFYEKDLDIDVYEKDIWNSSEIPTLEEAIDYNRNINFSSIKNVEFKNHLKKFCKHQLNVITFTSVYSYARLISYFFEWIDKVHPEITHLNQLNRQIIEDYFIWLRADSGFSKNRINTCILYLKVFFETGILLELNNFPEHSLILEKDYVFNTKKEAHPFVDSELKTIIEFIPKLKPKVYGKILYCMLSLGCRISELLHLRPEQLKCDNGEYSIILYQYKTKAEYEKPISEFAAKIMLSEVKHNKKIFGDNVEYVFLSEKGKIIGQDEINKALANYIIKNDIRDRDGNILHCNMHRFRSTIATNLLNSGYDVKSTGKLLGHKSLNSLAYYVVVNDEQVVEQLAPRIEKDELLISNIGKFDEKSLSDYDNPIPLCNGWCVRSSSLGQCAKANHCLECNMFIPTLSHLSMYEMQLRQVEAAIELAKANGMDLLVERNEKTKESLEKIIIKIRERRNANE